MPKIIADEKSVRVREREFSVRLSLRNAEGTSVSLTITVVLSKEFFLNKYFI